ncbi:phenylacetate--CoA ligase family protein [Halalkalibacter lacteus]|uniref:phenylacetate--CoA ligase family protein n=1 Tax=Halalkalibacter lacteus TaxID=3090663 RepID=UPI002FC709A1
MSTYLIKRTNAELPILLGKIKKSPFYQKKLIEISRPHSIKDIPFTTKEELRRASKFDLLAVEAKFISHYHESSGTTGIPSTSWYTKNDLETGGKEIAASGIKLNEDDLILIRFPFSLYVPAFLVLQAAYYKNAAVIPASSRNTVATYTKVLELMTELKATVFAGIPRELELLAETASQLSLNLHDALPNLRGILVAGELLSPCRKAYLEKQWGKPIYNLYGSTETGNIAKMCEYGVLHLSEENYLIEVYDEDLNQEKKIGEKGVAVITTLTNQGSPLLRYVSEDLVSLHNTNCKCGSNHLEVRHYGRLKDCLSYGSKTLSLYDFQEVIYSLEQIPIAWKVQEKDYGIEIFMQYNEDLHQTKGAILEFLTEKIDIPGKIDLTLDKQLFDTSMLLNNDTSRKPVYIEKTIQ